MVTIEELIENSNQKTPDKSSLDHRFILHPGSDTEKEIAALFACFASHENLLAIAVYQGEIKRGYIDRDAVLHSIDEIDKNLGTGELFFLSGDAADYYVVLKCSQPGCKQRVYLSYYDSNEKIFCPDHQNKIMEDSK